MAANLPHIEQVASTLTTVSTRSSEPITEGGSSHGRGHLEHIPALDGLRGAAILLVLIHHFTDRQVGTSLVDRVFREATAFGWVGVDLFFALSGFLITGILLRSRGSRNYLLNFFARRTLRIFPLYYFVLLLLFVAWPLLATPPDAYKDFFDRQIWYWTYTTNWLFAQQLPHPRFNTSHFWSLAVEEQFYLLWPLVVAFASKRTLMTVCVAGFAAAFGFRAVCLWLELGPSPAYVLTPARMDALLSGSFVAILATNKEWTSLLLRTWRPLIAASLVALAVVLVIQGNFRRGELMLTYGFSILAIINAATVGIVAFGKPTIFVETLRNRVLRFFGKYSYGIYVYHVFVLAWLDSWFPPASAFPSLGGTALPAVFTFMLTGIAISVACALVSWTLLERPISSLKRFFPAGNSATASQAV